MWDEEQPTFALAVVWAREETGVVVVTKATRRRGPPRD